APCRYADFCNQPQMKTPRSAVPRADMTKLKEAANNTRRALAFLIDLVIAFLIVSMVAQVAYVSGDAGTIAFFVAVILILIIRDSFIRGGSIGKHICGVILVDALTGRKLGRSKAALRQFALFVLVMAFGWFGYLAAGIFEANPGKRLALAIGFSVPT